MTISDMPPGMAAVAVAVRPAARHPEMLTRRLGWRWFRPALAHMSDGEALTYAPFGWFTEPRMRRPRR